MEKALAEPVVEPTPKPVVEPTPKPPEIETPQKEREQGFRIVNGGKVERQSKGLVKLGKETNHEFANNVSEKGHLGIIEADNLQPSHTGGARNPKHFIGEAQPKERTDKASEKASNEISGNLNPEKLADKTTNVYSGAPTVNERGEVIQGNNRAVGLKKYYANYPADPKGYKQFLLDNAEKLGLNPSDIESMKSPVLVNVLGASDNRAIALGQYNANDLESGGKQRIQGKETATKAGSKLENVVRILTGGDGDGEETIRGLIRTNGVEALKYLYHIKAINETQYTNAFKNNIIKKEAIDDLLNVLTHNLFKGGRADLDTNFEELPYRVQNALIKSGHIIRDISGLIQNVITADSEFKGSGIDTVDNWSNQISMFSGENETPEKRYGKTVLGLLKEFLNTKTEKELTLNFKKFKKLVDGEDGLFPIPGISIKEAFEQTFKLPYYDTEKDDTGRIPNAINKNKAPEAADGRRDGSIAGQPSNENSRAKVKEDNGIESKGGVESKIGSKEEKPKEEANSESGKEKKQSKFKEANKNLNEKDAAKLKELRAKLRKKRGQLNIGLDPETIGMALEATRLLFKAGMHRFEDYASAMLDMVGEAFRENIKSFYEFARHDPETKEYKNEMSSSDEVDNFDINKIKINDVNEDGDEINTNLVKNKEDAGNIAGNTKRDSKNNANGLRPDEGDVQSSAGQDNRSGQPGDRRDSKSLPENGRKQENSDGVKGVESVAAVVGKQVDNPIHNENESAGAENAAPGNIDPRGGGNSDQVRLSYDEAIRTKGVHEDNNSTPKRPSASPGGIELGNLNNIKETLPTLYEGQQKDVQKAEQRFFTGAGFRKETGKGMLFTNGTGTGKTFVGLGTAKRFVLRGKNKILIVVPSQQKASDWHEAGKTLNLKVHIIKDLKDQGKDISTTTYANYYQNHALQNRTFDLVIYDEVQKLGQSGDGRVTAYLDAHKIAANLPSHATELAEAELSTKKPDMPKPVEEPNTPDMTTVQRIKALGKYKMDVKKHGEEMAVYAAEYKKYNDLVFKRATQINEGTKVLMLSATPFAYHKSLQIGDGTLFNINEVLKDNNGERGGYNSPTGFGKFLVERLGYRMKYNKATIPESGVDIPMLERKLHEDEVKRGTISRTVLSVDKDYSRKFILMEDDVAKKINDGFKLFYRHDHDFDLKYSHLIALTHKKWNFLYINQLLESIKSRHALNRIQEHIDLGRKVVVFHSYNNAYPDHPFKFDKYNLFTRKQIENLTWEEKRVLDKVQNEIELFNKEYPEFVNLNLDKLSNPRIAIKKKFGDAAREFNGTENKKKRAETIKLFNDDNSNVKIIVVQRQAGKEGISLHDVTGKHQRVILDVGLPTAPTDAIQSEGRIYRLHVKTNAIIEYEIVGTDFERAAFASKVAERSETAENLAMGNDARNLKRAFVDGYQNAALYPPEDETGTGGKAIDRQILTNSPYDEAKSLYFARGKKTSRTKSEEGNDYYATPEPIGFKMAEWMQLKPSESALEPSAGHGAIARFFPTETSNTFIEPSYGLSSQLSLNVDGTIRQMPFEELYVGNKYNGIAMNPPFGVRAKLAGEHIEKAFKHLRKGGRIVAIVPNGGSMQHRLDAFLYGTDDKDKQLNPDAVLRAEYVLPPVTFARAGTKVNTKIIIIDKIENDEDAQNLYTQRLDFSNIDKIGDLFDALEGIGAPKRIDDVKATKQKPVSLQNRGSLIEPNSSALLTYGTQTHSQSGETMHMVFINNHLDNRDYQDMKKIAKETGGYFSRYSNAAKGIKSGFVFKSEANAKKFISEATKSNNELNESLENYHTFAADEDKKAFGTQAKRDEAIERTVKSVEGMGGASENGIEAGSRGDNRRESGSALFTKVKRRTVLDGFKESGEVNLNGFKIESPQDVADLYAIHRSPFIEKAHIVFVKDNKIVGTTATTINKSGRTMFFSYGEVEKMYDKFGASGMYYIHNHPSGNYEPSVQDVNMTAAHHEELKRRGVNLKGHVVIDHTKYSYINISDKPFMGNRQSKEDLEDYVRDEVENYSYTMEQPRFNTERESILDEGDAPEKIAKIGKAITNGEGDDGAVIYLTPGLDISAYDVFPEGASEGDVIKIAKEGLKNNLGDRIVIVHNKKFDFTKKVMPSETLDVINTDTNIHRTNGDLKKESPDPLENSRIVLWDKEKKYNDGTDPTKPSPELKGKYNKVEDQYFSETNWATARAGVEAQDLQTSIKDAFNKASGNDKLKDVKTWKEIDKAIHVYLDTKRDPEAKTRFYEKLSPDKKKLVDLSENLTPAMKTIAERIRKRYDELGRYAEKQGVIMNILDDYVNRLWEIGKMPAAEFWRKFGTSTRHAKKRLLGTILEGWSQGFELKIEGATNNLSLLEQEIANVVENRKLINRGLSAKDEKGYPVFTTKPHKYDGYVKIENPGFKKWEWDGQIVKAQDAFNVEDTPDNGEMVSKMIDDGASDELKIAPYKRADTFITSDGKVFKKKDIYAPPKIAKRLNNIFGKSALVGVPGFDQMTQFNAEAKQILLSYSFFHHIAFTRAYILSSMTHGFKDLNPGKAYKKGLSIQKVLHPDYELLVRNGLTTNAIQDWDETAIKGNTYADRLLRKSGISEVNIKAVKDFNQWQKDILFKKYGAGLKIMSGIAELNRLRAKYPEADENELAKLSAKLINDSFGGQHLGRKGRNQTVQHIYRLLGLAPDWTEARINTIIGAFKSGKEGTMYRHYWGRVLIRTAIATVMANALMAVFNGDDKESYLQTLLRMYKTAFRHPTRLNWLGIDITPLYKLAKGADYDPNKEEYFNLLGQFDAPVKYVSDPFQVIKNKSSVVARVGIEALLGENWQGKRYTSISEISGLDNKGVYLTSVPAKNGKPAHRIGDKKGGRLLGHLTKWSPTEKGAVHLDEIPSFLLAQVRGIIPIPGGNSISWAMGDMDGFEALTHSIGIQTVTATKLPDKEDENYDAITKKAKLFMLEYNDKLRHKEFKTAVKMAKTTDFVKYEVINKRAKQVKSLLKEYNALIDLKKFKAANLIRIQAETLKHSVANTSKN